MVTSQDTLAQFGAEDVSVAPEEPQVEETEVTEEVAPAETVEERADRLEAELTTERTAREKIERDQRNQLISTMKQRERDAKVDKTLTLVQQILDKQNNGEMDEAEAKVAIQQGVTKIEDEVSSTSVRQSLLETLKVNEATLKEQGAAIGLGEFLQDSKAENVVLFWNEAADAFNTGNLDLAEKMRSHALREFATLKERLETEQASPKRGNLSLNERNGSGASGQSAQALVNRYSRGESMPMADTLRAIKAMDEGTYPT
jgi:hypothetical protein|tara:strand:+ start:4263 stop:5039 length:777 start_codon:yes stop_codon:yes gene_type:complete